METVNLSKATVNLSKNQAINLSKKEDGSESGLSKIRVALGWDPKTSKKTITKKGLFGRIKEEVVNCVTGDYDLDAWVALRDKDGHLVKKCYYGNLEVGDYVKHSGDNLTGAGEGDDEVINVNLKNIPSNIQSILVGVTIYSAKSRNQKFADIENTFVRIVDAKSDKELCKYTDTFDKDYADCTSLIAGKFVREGSDWLFVAVGEGNKAGSIDEAIKMAKK